MSIKTFFGIILIHAFEQTFQKDSFRRVWNVFHGGHDFYAVVFQAFSVYRHLVLVAGESVKFVNENHVPLFFIAVFEHSLEIFAVIVCTGHGSVNIGVDDEDIVPFGKFVADALLPLDGLFGLAITP